MKILKNLILVSVLFLALSLLSPKTFSADCQPGFTYSNQDELNQIVSSCQQKVSSLQQQASSLSSEIQLFDTKIYLTTLQIQETENKIQKTQGEIETLGGKINNLNSSLDHLSKVLLEKIVEGYKKRETPLLEIFLDSNNASVLFNNLKYAKKTEQNDQHVAFQLQQAKTNFEQQKNLREQKKVELDQLTQTLNRQKTDLKNQQGSKKTLLADTQNSETAYQSLLARAKSELAGFKAFTTAAGGGLTSFGGGSNGWYYTQRDPSWGNMTLGNSPYSVWEAGCAVTSVAMVCKSYGQGTTPASIASDTNNFFYGDLKNSSFSCGGKSSEWTSTSQDNVRSFVKDRNIPVILRLTAPSVSGLHFVVAFKSDGDDFIIHDPYYGPDKKFSERYNWGQVTTAIAIH